MDWPFLLPPRRVNAGFDLQPTLVGEHITLRPLTTADFELLLLAAADPLIWEQHPEPDRWQREVFRRYFDSGIASGGAFAIVDRASGRMIGSSRFCEYDPDAGEIEIGWTFLERAYWGGAINGEMKALMLEHAFRFVDRVVFVVGEYNQRSQKALEKIGARRFRVKERSAPDGTITRHIVYAITR